MNKNNLGAHAVAPLRRVRRRSRVGTKKDRPSTLQRFWTKIIDIGDCLIWIGAKNPKGYGIFHNGFKHMAAHRFAYEQTKGPIPAGLQVDHLCRTRACMNPEHMEAVTNRENTLRGTGPTSINAKKTECKRGHKFDKENTVPVKGGRACLACRRAGF